MGFLTLVRGFKFSVSTFDDFLMANGRSTLDGFQPFPGQEEDIAKIFKEHGIDCEVRIFVPQMVGYDLSRHLYVCCDWIYVLTQKDIDDVFQEPVPPEFEKVRDLLGAKSEIRRYIIYNYERDMRSPEEVTKRYAVSSLLFSVNLKLTRISLRLSAAYAMQFSMTGTLE